MAPQKHLQTKRKRAVHRYDLRNLKKAESTPRRRCPQRGKQRRRHPTPHPQEAFSLSPLSSPPPDTPPLSPDDTSSLQAHSDSPATPPPVKITLGINDPFVESPSSYFRLSPQKFTPETPPHKIIPLLNPAVWETPEAHSTPRPKIPRHSRPVHQYEAPSYDCEFFLSRDQIFEKQQAESGPSSCSTPDASFASSHSSENSSHSTTSYHVSSKQPSWTPIRGLSTPDRFSLRRHLREQRVPIAFLRVPRVCDFSSDDEDGDGGEKSQLGKPADSLSLQCS